MAPPLQLAETRLFSWSDNLTPPAASIWRVMTHAGHRLGLRRVGFAKPPAGVFEALALRRSTTGPPLLQVGEIGARALLAFLELKLALA